MIPIRLRLAGFLSYNEPVELDFTALELACISGANGAGKSTLLDAITWVLFGQARRSGDAIINNRKNNAEVTFEFWYEEQVYRIQRSKPRDKATMLEFHVKDVKGDWRALTEHSLRETEARVQQILRMDYEVFTNASFFLQGHADQFAQQKSSDRKRILSRILGLEVWESYQDRAIQLRKQVEYEINMVSGQLVEIKAELDQEEPRRAVLKELQIKIKEYTQRRVEKEKYLEDLRRRAAELDQQKRMMELLAKQEDATRQRLSTLQATLQQRKEEQVNIQEDITRASDVETNYQRWQSARQQLARWEEISSNFRQYENQRAVPYLTIQKESLRLEQERQALLARKTDVDEQQKLIHNLDVQTTHLQHQLNLAEESLERRKGIEIHITDLQTLRNTALIENNRLKIEMLELQERITRLEAVTGAICPLCGQPLSPEDRLRLLEEMKTQGKDKGDSYRENQKLTTQYDEQKNLAQLALDSIQKVESDLRTYQRQLDQCMDQKLRIQELLVNWQEDGAERLIGIEEQIKTQNFALEARADLARLDASLKELGYDAAAHESSRLLEEKLRSSEEQLRHLENARARLEPLSREILGLLTQFEEIHKNLAEQTIGLEEARSIYEAKAHDVPDVRQVENEKYRLQQEENLVREQVGAAEQKVDVLRSLKSRYKILSTQKEENSQLVGRYRTLEKAFSKDGVPALLIEQALPQIEAEANEILDRLTDGNMSVRFETQREFKDKHRDDRKETLDILISDSAGMREYELYSGGEAFRINFAIRLALSRVLAQRAGARLQTLVIDEGFGSQDSEGRQRLIEAINLVRPDFACILVITHLEELKDAFPARIEVEKLPQGSHLRVMM
jgi:exonuclease SbcC